MHDHVRREFLCLLDQSLSRIEHCVAQLDQDQLWWQPGEGQHSVGILLRHIAGNLRQWAVAGITETADQRDRDAEFHSSDRETADQLLKCVQSAVTDAKSVLNDIDNATWLEPRTIQGFELTVLGAIMHTVPHMVGHTHQIVMLTRMQLGSTYEYHWTPDAPRNEVPL